MVSCTACGKAKALGACRKCKVPYCDRRCQKRHWKKVHKQFCSEDPSKRVEILVEHAVERALGEIVESETPPPEDVHCFICLEHGEGLLSQGCGCRGGSGFAHPECLEAMGRAEASSIKANDSFRFCRTCHQPFVGRMALEMARRLWRFRRGEGGDDALRFKAAVALGRVLLYHASAFDALDRLYASLIADDAKDDDQRRIEIIGDRARLLRDADRAEEALALLDSTATRLDASGTPDDKINFFATRSNIHEQLGDQRAALHDAKKAYDMTLAIYGTDAPQTHSLKGVYATNLARNGRLQEAEEIFDDLLNVCNRVYGPDHYLTKIITTTYDLELSAGD